MPLPKPTLDNRRFDQLVSEGRALIPRLAPRFTDHNASDPVITLLELGAWLSEQNIYRFDRLSEEAARAFVRLVGIEPAMPGVATTVVSIRNPNAAGLQLPARVQLGTDREPLFETTDGVFAAPAQLTFVGTGKIGAASVLDATAVNGVLSGFAAFGPAPRANHALYLGFDRALDAPGARLSLYIWTVQWQQDDATRAALIADTADAAAARPAHGSSPSDWRQHYRVVTQWEYFAGGSSWLPLHNVVDESRALSLSGFVRFDAPAGHQAGGVAGAPGSQFFVRCRIVRGRFECPPQLAHICLNAVACEHALSVHDRDIGLSRGHAGAVFELGTAPSVAGSIALRLHDGSGNVETDWSEAPDFDRAGAHDRVFVHDPERGELQSGNGSRGSILPAGFQLVASFRMGGGPDGNIAAGLLTRVPDTPDNLALVPALATLAAALETVQSFAALGGAPRETLASAEGRTFRLVQDVDKAVTLADIERLALATPGVPVARVSAVADMDPRLPCWPAPGVITLIVIPPCPRPAPMPSRALLDAVERHLAPRRLITSEIRAIAPRYRLVGVNAVLHLDCNANPKAVLAAAAQRLDVFFDPLDGGPDGTGWRFGRTVYRTEVIALLADTPGVMRVTSFALVSGCCGSAVDTARCDNVELCAHELVRPGRYQLSTAAEVAPTLRRSLEHECQPA